MSYDTPAYKEGLKSGWRTMESAPKDGTSVLIHCDWEPLTVVGMFKDDQWVVAWDEYPFEPGFEATHWCPIPEPPPIPPRGAP